MAKDLKYLYFDVLGYLHESGMDVETNIRVICRKYVKTIAQKESVDEAFNAFSHSWSRVIAILRSIESSGYIEYSKEHGDWGQLYIIDGNFSVAITKDGLDYYYTHLLRDATLKSLKNQRTFSVISIAIAVVAIVVSIMTTNENKALSDRVDKLQKEVNQKLPTPLQMDTIHKTVDTIQKTADSALKKN